MPHQNPVVLRVVRRTHEPCRHRPLEFTHGIVLCEYPSECCRAWCATSCMQPRSVRLCKQIISVPMSPGDSTARFQFSHMAHADVVGLNHFRLKELTLTSSCQWWQVVGNGDVALNVSVAVNVDGIISVVGVLSEVSRCLVGHVGELLEAVPPHVTVWSNGTVVSLTNLTVETDVDLLAQGCIVKEANFTTLDVHIDDAASNLPLFHSLVPLAMGSEWLVARLVAYARDSINANVRQFLPFDDVAC